VPSSTRVFLARHCDVANPERRLYGFLPGFALSARGVSQAEAMAQRLEPQRIRVVRTSPLDRAVQTAEIIAGRAGAPVVEDPDLIESRFSRYLQGVRYTEVPWRRPLWWVHMAWPGLLGRDETVEAMAGRVERALRRVLEEAGDGSGVCVSHGDPIQAFWIRSLGRRAWALHRLQCAKGGMLALDYSGERLLRITYVPPPSGVPQAPSPAPGPSHA
jgi:broad specificity phosphatase PhoE